MKEIVLYLDDRDKYVRQTSEIYQHENLASKIIINLPSYLVGYDYKLIIRLNAGTAGEITLTAVDGSLEYELEDTYTTSTGVLYLQLKVYELTGELQYRSQIYTFDIKTSLA